MTTTSSGSHRRELRRRGDALYSAIFQATLHELTETGYAKLSIERVAARARASKGSIYRRWPGRAELVADAIEHTLPRRSYPPDTGDVRTDLIDYLRQMAVALNSPTGEAIRGLMADTLRDPELAHTIRARFLEPTIRELSTILTRGAARGEVRPSALTHHIASVAPALLREHFLTHLTIPDPVVVEIVDEVLIPLIRP